MSKSIVCFGEVLLRLSPPGKALLLQSPCFDTHVGGAEANVAVSLSQFGHHALMVSALPESSLGRACAGELRRHAVDTAPITFREGRMGLYFATAGAGARPAEVLYDRAGSVFASAPPALFDWPRWLSGAAWLHISGITAAVSSSAAAAALEAMTTARAMGVHVSFDCNYRARLWAGRITEAPDLLRQLCAQADLLFGEERDMALILGSDATATAQGRGGAEIAFRTFPQLRFMACTQREAYAGNTRYKGFLHARSESFCSRAHLLHAVVDRIGAGDAFAAGVLHGLLAGFDPQRTIEFAAAAACLKHSIPGDFNLVSAADVELLLSEQHVDVRR